MSININIDFRLCFSVSVSTLCYFLSNIECLFFFLSDINYFLLFFLPISTSFCLQISTFCYVFSSKYWLCYLKYSVKYRVHAFNFSVRYRQIFVIFSSNIDFFIFFFWQNIECLSFFCLISTISLLFFSPNIDFLLCFSVKVSTIDCVLFFCQTSSTFYSYCQISTDFFYFFFNIDFLIFFSAKISSVFGVTAKTSTFFVTFFSKHRHPNVFRQISDRRLYIYQILILNFFCKIFTVFCYFFSNDSRLFIIFYVITTHVLDHRWIGIFSKIVPINRWLFVTFNHSHFFKIWGLLNGCLFINKAIN